MFEQHDGTGLSILLVDDDKDLRDALVEYLEGEGFRTTVSNSCRQALEALSDPRSVFHIVLADLRLPDGDGLEVIKKAKQKSPQILAAVMTGYASLETALEAIRLGAYDYITKPFSIDEIEILIRNMSDKISLFEQNRQAQEKLHEIYSKLELLQDEKIELIRANRELKQEYESISRKMDQLIHLFQMSLANSPRPETVLDLKRGSF